MRALLLVGCVATLWLFGLAATVLPVPFGGTWLSFAVSVHGWLAAAGVAFVVGLLVSRRAAAVSGVLTLVVAVLLVNWVSVAPRLWFETHRWAYDAARASATPGSSYNGSALPLRWRWLTVDGKVVDKEGALLFPQWYGMPDDGGGYFYAPDGSPAGTDMGGMLCQAPTSLGGGWWMCGL